MTRFPAGLRFSLGLSRHRLRQVAPFLFAFVLIPEGSPSLLYAQGSGELSGVVVEEQSARPLQDATIRLLESEQEVRTSESGGFFLPGVESGVVAVRASLEGYVSIVEELSITPDESTFVRLELPRLSAALEELLVTGSTGPGQSDHSEVTVPGNVDDGRSAADLLAQAVPGLDLRRNAGSAGGGANVRLRGSNSLTLSNEPLIYLDGIRVSPQSGVGTSRGSTDLHFLEQIPAGSVKRIRILKGPSAAAQFGNSSNGVILIETR